MTLESNGEPVFTPLPESFYRPSAEAVAPALLGHWLVRRMESGFSVGMIIETEAYLVDDPASHGFKGRTTRNAAMFGPPGTAYVYFIYGNHWCFNAVCGKEGVAEAVLIRALAPVFGVEWMHLRRPVSKPRELTSGPAKLCAALDIDRGLDTAPLYDSSSAVFIARNPKCAREIAVSGPMVCTTRIGLTKAADRRLRFYLDSSEFVSRR